MMHILFLDEGTLYISDRWNKLKVTYRLLGGPGERLRGPGERLRGDGLPRPLLVDSRDTSVSNSTIPVTIP
jgi:hypothetical protein